MQFLKLPAAFLRAPRTVDECMARGENNFDLLRLLAALLVLWSHSYPLTANGSGDIFSKMLNGYDTAGGFAVAVFFVISGFLVTRSASSRPTADYLAARALRILPALAVAVVMTVLVIGPILTRLPLTRYFTYPSTLAYFRNVTVYDIQFGLADTTSRLPYPYTINGSLWSLPLECFCYFVILALAKTGALSKRSAIFIVAAAVAGHLYATYVLHLTADHFGSMIWRGTTAYNALQYGAAFLLGSALWIYRKQIPVSFWIAAACAAALIFGARTLWAPAVYTLTVPYLVIFFAIGLPVTINLSGTIGDLSYGTYVFAFPIQQTVISFLGPHPHALEVGAIATPIVLTLACLSWHFVEKRALRLKAKMTGKASEVTATSR